MRPQGSLSRCVCWETGSRWEAAPSGKRGNNPQDRQDLTHGTSAAPSEPQPAPRGVSAVNWSRAKPWHFGSLINNPGVMGHLLAENINSCERSWDIRPLAGALLLHPAPKSLRCRVHRKAPRCLLADPGAGSALQGDSQQRKQVSSPDITAPRRVQGAEKDVWGHKPSQVPRGNFHLPLPPGTHLQHLSQQRRLLKVPSPPPKGSSPPGGSFKRQ